MNAFTKRLLIAFTLSFLTGLGAARAATGDDSLYFQSETYAVQPAKVREVLGAIREMNLTEDTDYAWVSLKKEKVRHLVCYSAECSTWAARHLTPLAVLPERPEAILGLLWKDPSLESSTARRLAQRSKLKRRSIARALKLRF